MISGEKCDELIHLATNTKLTLSSSNNKKNIRRAAYTSCKVNEEETHFLSDWQKCGDITAICALFGQDDSTNHVFLNNFNV